MKALPLVLPYSLFIGEHASTTLKLSGTVRGNMLQNTNGRAVRIFQPYVLHMTRLCRHHTQTRRPQRIIRNALVGIRSDASLHFFKFQRRTIVLQYTKTPRLLKQPKRSRVAKTPNPSISENVHQVHLRNSFETSIAIFTAEYNVPFQTWNVIPTASLPMLLSASHKPQRLLNVIHQVMGVLNPTRVPH